VEAQVAAGPTPLLALNGALPMQAIYQRSPGNPLLWHGAAADAGTGIFYREAVASSAGTKWHATAAGASDCRMRPMMHRDTQR